MKECLEEFEQLEQCNETWPDDALWPDNEINVGPDDADLTMVFFLKSVWKSKKQLNDGSIRPPKHLTSGKHGYRIRKWVK